ncbi:MAG: choice-of-anchor B family protein [Flavobacteriales bacterium]|nr:choice-of-anchor B family protein [Flavobacteriales bacterium]
MITQKIGLYILVILSSVYLKAQQVDLLYHWEDTSLPASIAHNNTYNEVWGFEQNGREYGVIGSTMGTHIFDVTDKNNITPVDFVPGKAQGGQIIHRDFHDYNGYLYMVCDEGASSLQIADLSYLPDSVSLVYDSDQLFIKSHNIFIDTAFAKLYVCSGDLYVYSLANPLNPTYFTTIDLPSHAHDLYVRNDTAYVNGGPDGLFIYDASVPNPQPLNTLSVYPQKGYNHSGWLTEDGNTYIFADETHGKQMKVLDVSDFNNLTIRSTFMTMTDPNSIPHNQIIKGNYLYSAQYFDGFYIYDISDPDNVLEVGSYDTSTQPVDGSKYEGAWGTFPFLKDGKVLVSDMQNGFYVFDVSTIVSVKENKDLDKVAQLFPNPTNGLLKIKLNDNLIHAVEIIDGQGKKVFNEEEVKNSLTIDLSEFVKGIYLAKISTNYGVSVHKILLQ